MKAELGIDMKSHLSEQLPRRVEGLVTETSAGPGFDGARLERHPLQQACAAELLEMSV